jgi:hypothetical protein
MQQMEVIGHDHKFMQQKPPLLAILRKNIHQKLSHAIGLNKRAASGCRRGHENVRVDWGAWGILTWAKARSWQDKAFSRV